MKLAIDVRMAHSSGIGTYIRSVVPGVIEQLPGVEICLLGGSVALEEFDVLRSERVKFVELTSSIYSIREQIELARKIPRGYDAFWALHYNIPLLWRGTLITTIYDVFHLAHPEMIGGVHKRLYAQFMFWAIAQKSNKVLSISHFTEMELERLTRISPEIVDIIPLGVDPSWSSVTGAPSPQKEPYFVFVGNVKPHKNLGALVAAFSRIKDQIPHNLVIIGKKDGFITGDEAVARLAEQCGERIVFTGFVSDEKLKHYIAQAQGMVFPSLYEGFGLPPLEAMACGCPVATSNAASLPEVCGDAALYFDPHNIDDIADKMMLLAQDEGVRQGLKTKGLARADTFNWDVCAAKTAKIIEQTLSNNTSMR